MNLLASILVATDLSAPARHAADRAALLAHAHNATLALVHVMPEPGLHNLHLWLGERSPASEWLSAQAAAQLDQLAAELQQSRQCPVEPVLCAGRVLDEIACEAEARAADLLVLGARGAGFLRRLTLGTTAERLLRRSSRPVLIVRQLAHESYRRVLVAVDFSAWSLPAVRLARRVAPDARLTLLHAWQVPFEDKLRAAGVEADTVEHYRRQTREAATQQLYALAEDAGLETGHWQPLIVEGEASQRLIEREQEEDADLIVLGKHGQSAAEELLLGSLTHHLLAEGTVDVLVSTQTLAQHIAQAAA